MAKLHIRAHQATHNMPQPCYLLIVDLNHASLLYVLLLECIRQHPYHHTALDKVIKIHIEPVLAVKHACAQTREVRRPAKQQTIPTYHPHSRKHNVTQFCSCEWPGPSKCACAKGQYMCGAHSLG